MARETLDGAGFEQVGVVFNHEAAADFRIDREAQLELGPAPVEDRVIPTDLVQDDTVHGGIRDVEHDLRQGRPAEVAALAQLLDEPVKRDILVGEGIQRSRPHARQHVAENRVPLQIRTQDQRVHKHAHQAFDIAQRPVCNRDTDGQVALPCNAMGEVRRKRRKMS